MFAVDIDKLPDTEDDNASAALVGFDLHFHTLGKASLTATYGRRSHIRTWRLVTQREVPRRLTDKLDRSGMDSIGSVAVHETISPSRL